MKYVDADVFLYWSTDHPEHGTRATQIIRHIELNEKAVTSTFTLWLYDKVMRETEGYALAVFVDQVTRIRNLRTVPLETDHLRDAAETRRKFNVPMEIAVAYAVARDRGASAVYSTNPAFDRTDLRREF